MKNKLILFGFTVIAITLASCSPGKQVYTPEEDKPVSVKPYEGEKTSVILKMYADTDKAAMRHNGFYRQMLYRMTPLFLPDSTYKNLEQPSPFSPNSMFYFAIGKPDYISINLRDPIQDSTQYIILRDSLPRGIYTMQFNRLDMESGVYLIEFRNRDTVTQRKGVFIK